MIIGKNKQKRKKNKNKLPPNYRRWRTYEHSIWTDYSSPNNHVGLGSGEPVSETVSKEKATYEE